MSAPDESPEPSSETIARILADAPNITPALIERLQRAAAQCHYALHDGGVNDEHARDWLRTIARGLLGDNEWEDSDAWFDEWAVEYRESQERREERR